MNPIFHEPGTIFWSIDPLKPNNDQQFLLNFHWGAVEYSFPTQNGRVRCVRGNEGGPQSPGAMKHYSANQDIVTDNFTGIQWQRNITNGRPTHEKAQASCQGIVLDGKTDWRLPTVKELSMELGLDPEKPSVGEFPRTVDVDFWSSTLAASREGFAWRVSWIGGIDAESMGEQNAVRCVR